MKYGWFSKRSKDMGHGTAIWLTPGGEELEVTIATESLPKTYFNDVTNLGEIIKFVRVGEESTTLCTL
jgi:hypothetical protein